MTKEEKQIRILVSEYYAWVRHEDDGSVNSTYKERLIIDKFTAFIQSAIAEHSAIQWKPYPANVPEKRLEFYLITDDDGNVYSDLWEGKDWADHPFVIAFRELPEPYKPE